MIAEAVSASLLLLSANSPPEQEADTRQQKANTEIAQSAVVRNSTTAKNPVKGVVYKPPCSNPKDNNGCALEAQWKAAEAARDAVNWAKWQTILSFFGIIGLLVSLYFTRIATLAAAGANKDAENALRIAETNANKVAEQVEVTRLSAERQLRAYVGIEKIEVAPAGGKGFASRITIKNFGKTPAYNCVISIASTIEDWPSISPDYEKADYLSQGHDLSLQPSAEMRGWASCDDDKTAAIQMDIAALYVFGHIDYVDIEGKQRKTSFTYRGTGDVFLRTLELIPCVTGNEAT
jgi:hypothetical protein